MSWRNRWPDAAAGVALAAFAAGLTPAARVTQPHARPLDAAGIGLLVVAGGAAALLRRWPLPGYLVALTAATGYLAAGFGGWPVYVAALVALLGLAAGVPRRLWLPAGVAGGAAIAVATGRPEGWAPGRMVAVFVIWCVVLALAGEAAVRRARRAEEQARARLVAERLRIARELHDVLSHSLASISLQAGAGLHVLDTDLAQARQMLTDIRATSTGALAQARAALATIRGEQAPAPPDRTGPDAPGLQDLPKLIASVRAAGLEVRLQLDEPGPLPAAVSSTAYRLVQEALTNVMRHAGPGATAQATVGRAGQHLHVEVCDDGRAPARIAVPGPGGHGLVGMRERVGELGGRLEAGPAPDGGFRVAADLPLGGGAR